MLKWVRAFNRYDLYSKGSARPDVQALMPFYRELVEEFFPDPVIIGHGTERVAGTRGGRGRH